MQYLEKSNAINQKLTELFSGEGKKWAVVAFVGPSAINYLPKDVTNLSVVCWPKAGGTDPDGIRKLIKKGIDVYFCNHLHHKIYWKENAGLIIGSANLSNNGLGDNAQHEFGVYSDDKNFDITEVLSELRYLKVTDDMLEKLDKERDQWRLNNPKEIEDSNSRFKVPTFPESSNMPFPRKFKIITWCEKRNKEECAEIKSSVESEFGSRKYKNDNDVEINTFDVGELVLQVKTDYSEKIIKANPKWFRVEFKINKGKKKAILVQRSKSIDDSLIPFEIDSKFIEQLKIEWSKIKGKTEEWEEVYDENQVVNPKFLQKIAHNITK